MILIFRRFSRIAYSSRRVSLYAETNPSILLPSIFIFLYFCFFFSCSLRFIISSVNVSHCMQLLRRSSHCCGFRVETKDAHPHGYNSCLLVNFCFKPLTSSRRVRERGVHIVLLIKCIILWRLHTKHSVVYPFSNKSIRLLTALFHMTTRREG